MRAECTPSSFHGRCGVSRGLADHHRRAAAPAVGARVGQEIAQALEVQSEGRADGGLAHETQVMQPVMKTLAEPDADADEARTLRPLQTAALTYRIAFRPRPGQKVLKLRGATPREGTLPP